jgi:hypothetical protein
MTLDQFIQWIQDHVADQQAATQELDELVHDAKADEAADINNGGIESQLRYLLGEDSLTVSSGTMEEYCRRLEVPLPHEDSAGDTCRKHA